MVYNQISENVYTYSSNHIKMCWNFYISHFSVILMQSEQEESIVTMIFEEIFYLYKNF